MNKNNYLLVAGITSFVISFVHILIIIGGADWYRFFGAGEEMARLAETGSTYPAMTTSIIAVLLAVWGFYGLSGAGLIKKLPVLKPVLIIVSMIFIIRGIAGIPLVLWVDDPYLNELEERILFMIFSSLISLLIGVLYLIGTIRMKVNMK